MKKIISQLSVSVLMLVAVMASGCAAPGYKYQNEGGTTDKVVRTPDGGYERTTTYRNSGSGSGYLPIYNQGGWGGGGAPSSQYIGGMIPDWHYDGP